MSQYLRSTIRAMSGYTPGEQPQLDDFIKLNTNENPYPPSPRVAEAIESVLASGRLRKYPEPTGATFRRVAGSLLGVDPDAILIGNGSDDILTIVTRAFVAEGGTVVSLTPSYLLYQTLADIQGATLNTVRFTDTWQLPKPWPIPKADLTFLPNPNSPSGTLASLTEIERLAEELDGPLVIDEAYADFAEWNAISLSQRPNIIVTRSMSKSYSLAGLRFGFGVAQPQLVRELNKVKDSYNCDMLGLVGATAALEDQEYFQETCSKILATRDRMGGELLKLGFAITASQANFIWAERADRPVQPIFEELKRRKILVRYMSYEGYGDGLRITVGTDAEVDRLLEELREIV